MVWTILAANGAAEKPSGNYSRLARPGPDGRLVYEPDKYGNIIPDFSYSGYCGGGVRLPNVRVRAEIKSGGGNDAARIQAAIDRVAKLPVDKNGFRGAVLLKRGLYKLDRPLSITEGGIVLRGEGSGEQGTVLFGKGVISGKPYRDMRNDANLIDVRGEFGVDEIRDTATRILDEYLPAGSRVFSVESAARFRSGDRVIVRRYGDREWFAALGLDYDRRLGRSSHDFERTITGIEENRITIDIPLTCAVEAHWSKGELVKYSDSGRIAFVGIEHLRGISEYDESIRTNRYDNANREVVTGSEYVSDENHYWNFIKICDARDIWVRDIAALHFAGSAVFLERGCIRATVLDCESLEPVSYCGDGRRLSFLVCGQLCLVRRCRSDRGRHSFAIGGLAVSGPNVFFDCIAAESSGDSGPYSNLASGVLYDNVQAALGFRYDAPAPSRWMGMNSIMWNCEGAFIIQQPPTALNYSIGHTGEQEKNPDSGLPDLSWREGYVESLNKKVEPRSLYLKQLEDRLGKKAARIAAMK